MIEQISNVLRSPIFLSMIGAWGVSVILKPITYYIKKRKFILKKALANGGMPSSHSAFTTALATSLLIFEGATSVFFIALAFACITAVDAASFRYQAGQQNKVLNEMMKLLEFKPADHQIILKEVLGHTKLQVFFGIMTGIIVPYAVKCCY